VIFCIILLALAILLVAYQLTEYVDWRYPGMEMTCRMMRVTSVVFCLGVASVIGYLSGGWILVVPTSILGIVLGWAISNVHSDLLNYRVERNYTDES
jgi:hypothetical protein